MRTPMTHPEVKIEQRQIHDAVAIDLARKEAIEAKSARRALSVEGPPQQLTVDAYDNASVTDAAGRTWLSGDIYATGAVTASFTLMFVAVLSFFVIVRRRYDPLV